MADAVGADMSAVKALAADLGRVKSRLLPAMRAVTSKAALNIKNDAQASIRAQTQGKFVKQYPNSITYDIAKGASSSFIQAEIGPDKDKPQGALGNILEYGTPNNPGGFPHLNPALDNEAPAYESFLSQAAADAIFGT